MLCLRSRAALAAENLFLRKQLAFFEERKAQPHRATDAVRFVISALVYATEIGMLSKPHESSLASAPLVFTRWIRSLRKSAGNESRPIQTPYSLAEFSSRNRLQDRRFFVNIDDRDGLEVFCVCAE